MERARAGNRFGVVEALFGLAAGFVLSAIAIAAYASAAHLRANETTEAETIISLFALWAGFVGAAVAASRLGGREAAQGEGGGSRWRQFCQDYGLYLRLWPDVPLGLLVGVASQLILVPLLELPLEPFVHNLSSRLGHPTRELLGPAKATGSAGFVFLAVLVCVGSPLVEELFFRGLFLRGLLYRSRRLGRRLGPVVAVVVTGLFFGLVHFEALQFLGLAGFGIVLGVLAWWSGRLGPSVIAHLAFNATTVLAYAYFH